MAKRSPTQIDEATNRQKAPLATPTDLAAVGTRDIAGALNGILAGFLFEASRPADSSGH
jgi:hypothetical protein